MNGSSQKTPDEFGKGAMAGLAAPEAANNAASVGALIPMMTLGIPGSGTTAIMLGVLILLGLQPGPLLFEKEPTLVWGLIASMYIGNIILAIVNIPLAKYSFVCSLFRGGFYTNSSGSRICWGICY